MNSVIASSNGKKMYEGLQAYSSTISEILTFINSRFNASFELYIAERYPRFPFEKTVEDGYKEGKFKFISHVHGLMSKTSGDIFNPKLSKDILTNFEAGGAFNPMNNAILYNEEYGIVVAFYDHIDSNNRTDRMSVVFAKCDEDIIKFSQYVQDQGVKRRNTHVATVVNTRHGAMTRFHVRDLSFTRDDVFMDAEMKEQIFRSIDTFFNGDGKFFKENNIAYKRGILLHGAPGNGKTTLIKSIISTVDAPIISWQVSEYTTSDDIMSIFEDISNSKESTILILEDLDSIPEKSRSTFLNCLDGLKTETGIFIIGTTNYPEKIDPAIMNRAGRFDRSYKIAKPSYELRRDYLVRKGISKFIDDEKLDALAKETDTFSMSMLNEVYTTVALESHYSDSEIDTHAIVKAIKKNLNEQKTGNFTPTTEERTVGFL